MKPDVLVMKPPTPDVAEALERSFAVHRLWEAEDRSAFLREIGATIRGIATTGGAGASAELMRALPNLEIVAVNGVGLDAVDLAYAKEAGVVVANTPDVLTEDVADMALLLLLAAAREAVAGDAHVRSGAWEREGARPLSRRVHGKRAGILGLGRIGRAVARRLEALDIQIVYHNRRPIESPYVYYSDLEALARDVDFLVVTAAGGEGSRGLVDRAVIDALGPDGILVNVARGTVVDQEALIEALRENRLAAAGLDVFEDEPRVPESLRNLPNVVLQPHHGSGTVETRAAMGELVVRNLEAHFAGRLLPTPVDLG
ncbi:2-hydroxyacid dehydrogenase [Planctomyces sp. SH-PL62]|uniref:2-hydroxyacid dehydrogenase n=1 Tax=Planctomyces sp. SH-PL62 TaxID=1636152 RepID=UPI00078CC9AB|nr:2-hydroxyacid dehydrogenase [Planctomyces sp. SH-PL62]AMV38437.1 Glyoxylate/hydroxypyruvate reductase B [Planctomyces sp. SH-PL62]